MTWCSRVYWRMKRKIRERILKYKYHNMDMMIDYDWRLRTYVHPYFLTSGYYRMPLSVITEDLAHKGLCFEFKINGEWTHRHDFNHVMILAYNKAETFELPDECRDQYSKQEIEMIEALVSAGKKDRRKYKFRITLNN